MGQRSPIIFGPIADEIQRIVDRALASGCVLSASDAADDILQTFPGTGLTPANLADQVMLTAASAGVPVEIDRRHSTRIGPSPAQHDREAV